MVVASWAIQDPVSAPNTSLKESQFKRERISKVSDEASFPLQSVFKKKKNLEGTDDPPDDS